VHQATPGPGVFYDLTPGLNYTPGIKLIIRPEIRRDWFDSDTGVGASARRPSKTEPGAASSWLLPLRARIIRGSASKW
jgi:hypothetical protein